MKLFPFANQLFPEQAGWTSKFGDYKVFQHPGNQGYYVSALQAEPLFDGTAKYKRIAICYSLSEAMAYLEKFTSMPKYA